MSTKQGRHLQTRHKLQNSACAFLKSNRTICTEKYIAFQKSNQTSYSSQKLNTPHKQDQLKGNLPADL